MPSLFLLKGILLFAGAFLIFATLFGWAFGEPYPLCVEGDCSYTWEIQTGEEWKKSLEFWVAPSSVTDLELVQGFTVYSEKIIIVNDLKHITHEWYHAKCNLDHKNNLIEAGKCHERLDSEIYFDRPTPMEMYIAGLEGLD